MDADLMRDNYDTFRLFVVVSVIFMYFISKASKIKTRNQTDRQIEKRTDRLLYILIEGQIVGLT